MLKTEDRIHLESRISKMEEGYLSIHDDIKDMKRTIRWAVGLIFSLNSTIIGLLAQHFKLL